MEAVKNWIDCPRPKPRSVAAPDPSPEIVDDGSHMTWRLAGRERTIPVLPFAPAQAWRAKFAEAMSEVLRCDGPGSATSDDVRTFIVHSPERVVDLVCEYARQIDPVEIREHARDDEISAAFSMLVLRVGYAYGPAMASSLQPLSGSA